MEEPALRAYQAKKRLKAQRAHAPAIRPADHQLKATQLGDDKNNPTLVGLEESLLDTVRRKAGPYLALAGVGLSVAQGPALPVPEVAVPAPGMAQRQVGQPAAPTFLSQLDPALVSRMQAVATQTQRFFAGQKMADPVEALGGFTIRGYQSYKPNEDHPFNQYLGIERFWIYDMGVTLAYLLRRGELSDARWLADHMMDIAKQMDTQGQKGGWRFSYGTSFTDARAMSGGTAWMLKELYGLALKTHERTLLAWLNTKLVEIAFAQQVMDPKDPRYGLFRAGFGETLSSGPEIQREEVTTEHNWDYIDVLRMAYRANAAGDPKAPILAQIIRRHELAMQQSRAKLLLTAPIVQAQLARLRTAFKEKPTDDEDVRAQRDRILKQHERVIVEVRALPGQRRWATGMEPDGTLNLSWAWDNEGWSPHGAYDPDMAYNELRNLEARFLKTMRARDFDHLPAGVNPTETFTGLIFFTGDFEDPHVEPNPAFEQMLQPEATWSYLFRLVQFGYHTTDPAQRTWAYTLAKRLVDSMLRLTQVYGGAPYATKDVQGFFNTMLSIASNGHQGIVLEGLLRGGAPADDYLNALPSREMTVSGNAPTWAAPRVSARGGLEEKGWGRTALTIGLSLAVGATGAWWAMKKLSSSDTTVVAPPPSTPSATQPVAAPTQVPTQPPPAVRPLRVSVTPETLTVTFPEALAGKWAAALMFIPGDVGYLQGVMEIPKNGAVEFSVPVELPNRPGWKASTPVIAVYDNQDAAHGAGMPLPTRPSAVRAPLVIQIRSDGSPGVMKGELPGTTPAPAPAAPRPSAPVVSQPAAPAPTVPAQPQAARPQNIQGTLLEPFVQAATKLKQAIPGAVFDAVFWDPANTTQGDFKVLVEMGFSGVVVDGYRFVLQGSEQDVLDRIIWASQAGMVSFKFVVGDPSWGTDAQDAAESMVTELAGRIVALKTKLAQRGEAGRRAAALLKGIVIDVEPYLAPGFDNNFAPYVQMRDHLETLVRAKGLTLDAFEPFWVGNRADDAGKAFRGYRDNPRMQIYPMSYRRDGRQAFGLSNYHGTRVPHASGFDLATGSFIGFDGRFTELPAALTQYVDLEVASPARKKLTRGFFIHAKDIAQLRQMYQELTKSEAQRRAEAANAQAEAQQARAQVEQAKGEVKAEVSGVRREGDSTFFTVKVTGPKTMLAGAVAVVYKKTDIYYRQPVGGEIYELESDGTVTVQVEARGQLGDVVIFIVNRKLLEQAGNTDQIRSPAELKDAVITTVRPKEKAQTDRPVGPPTAAIPLAVPIQHGLTPNQFLTLLLASGDQELQAVGETILMTAFSASDPAQTWLAQWHAFSNAQQASTVTAPVEARPEPALVLRSALDHLVANSLPAPTPRYVHVIGQAGLEEGGVLRALRQIPPVLGLSILLLVSADYAQANASALNEIQSKNNVYAFDSSDALVRWVQAFGANAAGAYGMSPAALDQLRAAAGDRLAVQPVSEADWLLTFFQQIMAQLRGVPVESLSAEDHVRADQMARLAENL